MRAVYASLVLFLAFALYVFAATDSANGYTETGECQEPEVACSYSYVAEQEFSDDGENQKMSIQATVDITCSSSGVYNASDAMLYCMSIRNAGIVTNLLENLTKEEIGAIQQSLNEQLANWFCFVQSSSGKIPAVYHSSSEPDHIISLKKGIAAAFQANFEGTEEEEEIDPQSRHLSHYSYTPVSEEGAFKMKRTVRRPDVSEYSSEAPVEDIDTSKDEEIEYQSGKLWRSSGNASFHLANNSQGEGADLDLNSFSLTQAFSASGSYSLEMQSCNKINSYAYKLQKQRIMSEVANSKEEDLKATVDKKKEGIERMKMLREKFPAGSALKALQGYDEYGDHLVPILQHLIELESQYGALPLYVPVIDDVMTFITMMPATASDKGVREAVIMILTDEGSMRSQMALLSAYDNALDSAEANNILVHISFMKKVRIGFVIGMEERLNSKPDDRALASQLLLVYASLAIKGSDEVEDRVTSYLDALVTDKLNQSSIDVTDITLLLHALGNTGSKLSIASIFSIWDASINSDDYNSIELAAIESLAKYIDDPIVLSRLDDIVNDETSLDCIATIIDTLENGLEYMNAENHLAQIRNHPLIYSLIETVASSNDSNIFDMMEHYLGKIHAGEVHYNMLYDQVSPLGRRARRGTDWDQNHGDYSLVSSLSQRQSDVNTYPAHNAYINSKRIGIDEANIKIAYGYFAGRSVHCDRAKIYGRTKVVGTLLTRSSTIADVKVDLRATTTSASINTYARVGNHYLLNYNYGTSLNNHCFPYSRTLTEYRTRLFRWSFTLFIYVSTLSLGVDVDAHFNMGLNTNMCIGRTGTEATGAIAALTPTVGITVTGSVSAGLLYLVRGGIDVSVTLSYRLEPVISAQGCTAYCSLTGRLRLGLFESHPNNNINLYAWWQHQSVGMCGSGWFRYPCFRWSRKHRWDALSATWDLGSQSRRSLWQYCTGNLHPVCTDGALDSYLFTCA